MKFRHFILILMVASLWLPAASEAQSLEIKPFYTQNQSPLSHIFGLPPMGEAKVLAPGRKELRFSLDHASNYVKNDAANESILLDGETTRLGLALRYGVRPDYHNAFGFPQGGRDQAPRDRLLYEYRKNNTDLLKVDRSGSGLGDIRLQAAWQLYKGGDRDAFAAALRGSVKLPTGDSDQLFGSGSYDGALWLTAAADFPLAYGSLSLFGAAGMMGMTEGKVIKKQQNNWAGFGSVGIGWSPLSWLALKIQTDAHTPFFRDSDLRELRDNAAQLVVGGTVALTKNMTLDIGVSEDILVSTAPDVVFHLSLNSTF